jgi:hypothetical protein
MRFSPLKLKKKKKKKKNKKKNTPVNIGVDRPVSAD